MYAKEFHESASHKSSPLQPLKFIFIMLIKIYHIRYELRPFLNNTCVEKEGLEHKTQKKYPTNKYIKKKDSPMHNAPANANVGSRERSDHIESIICIIQEIVFAT